MEYCENIIKNKINKNEKIKKDFICQQQLIIKCIKLFTYCKKIVHLDCKQLNLILYVDKNIKIIDFGMQNN